MISDRLERCDDPPDTAPSIYPHDPTATQTIPSGGTRSSMNRLHDGVAMGTPLSPIVANIYMECFEKLALDTAAVAKPKLWLHYLDDTFFIWEGSRDELDTFLHYLNSIRSSIQFTMEMEDESQLPFLDVMFKSEDHRLTTTVYRKKTHADHYIHFMHI